MNITKSTFRHHDSQNNNVVAFADIELDNFLVIRNIRITRDDDKTHVLMPDRKCKNGQYRDIVHPISKKLREQFEEDVLNLYFDWLDLVEDTSDELIPLDESLNGAFNLALAKGLYEQGKMSQEDFTKISAYVDSRVNDSN